MEGGERKERQKSCLETYFFSYLKYQILHLYINIERGNFFFLYITVIKKKFFLKIYGHCIH